jgi:hypothetical protein
MRRFEEEDSEMEYRTTIPRTTCQIASLHLAWLNVVLKIVTIESIQLTGGKAN